MTRDSVHQGFSGRLQNFSLLDILQMACLAQRTGVLEIHRDAVEGRLFLARGQIVHAEAAEATGPAALLRMLCWNGGEFRWNEQAPPPARRTIQGSWEHVLMEAIRQRDEWEHREPAGVSAEFTVTHPPALPMPEVGGAKPPGGGFLRRRMAGARRWRRVLLGGFAAMAAATAAVLSGHYFVSLARDPGWRHAARAILHGRRWQPQSLPEAHVPPGDFIFQNGQIKATGAFRIDSAEVTVWQYAAFLREVGGRTDYDHPNQPRGKGHRNPDWDALEKAAFAFSRFRGQDVTPNTPATFLDWFDAYAYAHWRGRRLPTEEEWEKAGRGPGGARFPWGNTPRAGAANVFAPNRGTTGPSEAAAWPADRSPYGVYDMAGNVSEWTASFDPDGNPVVKGGNFDNDDAELTRRILHLSPLTKDARIGFRTVSGEETAR